MPILKLSCSQGYGIVECNRAEYDFHTITVIYGTAVPNPTGMSRGTCTAPATFWRHTRTTRR